KWGDCNPSIGNQGASVAGVVRDYAAFNGFSERGLAPTVVGSTYQYSTSDTLVTATCPYTPTGGAAHSAKGQVTVQKKNGGALFSGLFSDLLSPQARAVAAVTRTPPGSVVIALDPSCAKPGITLQGGSYVTVTGGVTSNSCNYQSITAGGTGTALVSDHINVVGKDP